MEHKKESYRQKRERFLNAVEFKPIDRLPFQGWNGTIAALEKVTGRCDYRVRPKEVFTEAMKAWDVDAILQFVLPERYDNHCGVGAVANLSKLNTAVFEMLENWVKQRGPVRSPEDFRDFCATVPSAARARDFVDVDGVSDAWHALNNWGEFLKPMVWIPGHRCGKVSWMC